MCHSFLRELTQEWTPQRREIYYYVLWCLRALGHVRDLSLVMDIKFDSLGLALSGACLVHCLLLPVVFIAAPTASVWLGATENAVHWVFMLIALGVSGSALYIGFKHHAVAAVVALGVVGLLVMLVGAAHIFGRGAETALTVTGAAIVAAAHLINVRLCARQNS